MRSLPRLMVAPNGARKTKADHPALPITLEETVATAVACHAAGAQGAHLHVRDAHGHHVLDAGLYRELLSEMHNAVPNMMCQITTEAVGRYTAAQQRQLVDAVQPKCVSISLAEMLSDGDTPQATRFYAKCKEADISVQHILYDAHDLRVLSDLLANEALATDDLQVLFVLGRYSEHQESTPQDLGIFTQWLGAFETAPDWAVCAFGKQETACLTEALRLGGKIRVGFENSFWNANGTIANSNSERVAEMNRIVQNLGPHSSSFPS
ncbi:3-keto-5-aminohexanoate cleavage protein [Falsihalocynthiibacter sp. S25ZX9]|uniref:3-keto-5-aminohexanoate cleavage protein n=1 Tax=Falsihalocynthiibacter sp. S25ZX9 TaxID=3240870 RepID=UPI00350FF42E